MRNAPGKVLQAPSAYSERAPRRVSPSVPLRRTVEAFVLLVVLFTLTVLAGPHLIEHLLSTDGDSDHCVVCAAIHGARAGVPAAPVVLVPALLLVGLSTPQPQPPASAVASASPSPRGPPVIG